MLSSGLTKKNRLFSVTSQPFVSYLARPKLGNMRTYHSLLKPNKNTGSGNYGFNSDSRFKKMRNSKKTNGIHSKMDSKKRLPDYTDLAYREAVSRLRVLLAESYYPKSISRVEDSGDDTDDKSMLSGYSRLSRYRHYHPKPPLTVSKKYPQYLSNDTLHLKPAINNSKVYTDLLDNKERDAHFTKVDGKEPSSELLSFIERQEDYIEQLERESQFCRDELSGLLGKVKEVISENETLHEKQKSSLFKSVFDHLETETEDDHEADSDVKPSVKSPKLKSPKQRSLEGPSIVFESRISELEAYLTQCKIDLRKAQEENDMLKKKITDTPSNDTATYEGLKKQIENLKRDKDNLEETVSKLQSEISLNRNKDNDLAYEAKGAIDHARWEKGRLEADIRRLQAEIQRVRDNAAEQTRRAADEKDAVERRYSQQVDQLSTDLAVQWDTNNKLQLEIEKQRREITELRRELAQKNALIDDYRKDLQSKTVTLQSEQSHSNAEKTSLEQELANARLVADRTERISKQETTRLNTEISSLHQRLDRADADILHARRENLRLAEQLAAAEKELNITKMINENHEKRLGGSENIPALMPPVLAKSPDSGHEKEISSMIIDMEAKHAATVAELEGMIHSQNALMEKLTGECHSLTQRLEEASVRHKQDREFMKTEKTKLLDTLHELWSLYKGYLKINCPEQMQVIKPNLYTKAHFIFNYRQEMAELQTNLKYLSNSINKQKYGSKEPHINEDMHLERNAESNFSTDLLSNTSNTKEANDNIYQEQENKSFETKKVNNPQNKSEDKSNNLSQKSNNPNTLSNETNNHLVSEKSEENIFNAPHVQLFNNKESANDTIDVLTDKKNDYQQNIEQSRISNTEEPSMNEKPFIEEKTIENEQKYLGDPQEYQNNSQYEQSKFDDNVPLEQQNYNSDPQFEQEKEYKDLGQYEQHPEQYAVDPNFEQQEYNSQNQQENLEDNAQYENQEYQPNAQYEQQEYQDNAQYEQQEYQQDPQYEQDYQVDPQYQQQYESNDQYDQQEPNIQQQEYQDTQQYDEQFQPDVQYEQPVLQSENQDYSQEISDINPESSEPS